MIEKSGSTSLALATIAILGQAPRWVASMMNNEPVYINGDGETSRDFCFIEHAVQANILAATTENEEALNQVYNVAVGDRTTLNQSFELIRSGLQDDYHHLQTCKADYRDFRAGDVKHSLANISKANRLLTYTPTHRIDDGLKEAMFRYTYNIAIK